MKGLSQQLSVNGNILLAYVSKHECTVNDEHAAKIMETSVGMANLVIKSLVQRGLLHDSSGGSGRFFMDEGLKYLFQKSTRSLRDDVNEKIMFLINVRDNFCQSEKDGFIINDILGDYFGELISIDGK